MKNFTLIIILIFSFFTTVKTYAENINGEWEGKLKITPELSLRFVLNITYNENKPSTVTMDSPDQGAYGIPLNIVYLDKDSVNVSYPQLAISYKGRLTDNEISGNFTQGGLTLPLTLSAKSEIKRPQTPQPPFPYKSEDVSFPSSLDDALLYGTLTLPPNYSDITPVAILISGSGTQNRDEELFGHKPFAVIADYLARNGIASLRYDDRGFDPAKGLSPNSNTAQNALDAKGAIKYLRQRGLNNIGIIGHSEGGLIADMLAAEGNNLRFIIEIGGPAVSGDRILLFQNEYLLRDGKMPDNYIAMYLDAMKGILDSRKNSDATPFVESDYEIFSKTWKNDPVVAPLIKNLKDNFYQLPPWVEYFINYDPISDIGKIQIPVLMIYGEKDTQVPPALNLPALENSRADVTIKVFPGLNHLMQHCSTGKVTEYADIEETISPEVLEEIKNFITSAQK